MSERESDAAIRKTICFPAPGTQEVIHHDQPAFQSELARHYHLAESRAMEGLINLKSRLSRLSTDDFFIELTEGMSKLLNADITFVMKRMLVDEQNAAVEMPPIGEPGSCLMAAALHYRAGDDSTATLRETKFHAWGCPCAYMRHDKVFLIPANLNDFITNNPNTMPKPAEAYLAVPLFAQGKCFAHFGAMWSKEGLVQRATSWAFTEMLMHSLEDMILSRLLEGANFARPVASRTEQSRLIPHDAISIAQSLRPYAGSLSHELRTPMQGVVGMLDVMYATVEEAASSSADPNLRRVFQNLKENIEVVQDSSRRAVEAADNVVHAYDMDMSVPDGPPSLVPDDSTTRSPHSPSSSDTRTEIFIPECDLPPKQAAKRKLAESDERTPKQRRKHVEPAANQDYLMPENLRPFRDESLSDVHLPRSSDPESTQASYRAIAPGLRHTSMREIFQYVISEGLKVGGRPDKAITEETAYGERIEVRSRGSDGTASTKLIEWTVDPGVPATMLIDERDVIKLVSCLFLNALKFTDKDNGRIELQARMSARARYICIKVLDNGPGIPAAFLPRLFKAFSQEDASLTRQSEGLGLGLMVAKGIARRLGGDLSCIRADTAGHERGTEFEIRIPLTAGETLSRPASPFSSPVPRRTQKAVVDMHEEPTALPDVSSSSGPQSSVLRQTSTAPIKSLPATVCNCMPMTTVTSRPPSADEAFHLRTIDSRHSTGSYVYPAVDAVALEPQDRPSLSRKRTNRSIGAIDRNLATRYPLNFLVAEDNKINRKLLVSMLAKLGYKNVHEAHDGTEAVRQMTVSRPPEQRINVVLMDLWMPLMDGYEATERILLHSGGPSISQASDPSAYELPPPTVLAVTADVTDGALERAARVGMKGFMTKPYKMYDLQRLITEYCTIHPHTQV